MKCCKNCKSWPVCQNKEEKCGINKPQYVDKWNWAKRLWFFLKYGLRNTGNSGGQNEA